MTHWGEGKCRTPLRRYGGAHGFHERIAVLQTLLVAYTFEGACRFDEHPSALAR